MTPRTISAIVFAIIVAIELIVFAIQPEITKTVSNGKPRTGLFGGYDIVTDYEAQNDRNAKYATIIGATVILSAIVTFALPNTKIDRKKIENNKPE